MPQTPLIIAGHVYTHGSTTAIENVIVTVKNATKNEEHNGAEDAFPELTTNSAGEFQANLANFTTTYEDDDIIEVSLNYDGKRDLVTYTLSGTASISSLVLTPLNEDIFSFERTLEDIGEKVAILREAKTLDTDYDSADTERVQTHPIGGNIYASVQIEEDSWSAEDQGVVSHGIAKGYFKCRYEVAKDNIIRVPPAGDNYWRVQDKPVIHRSGIADGPHHYEANLVRIGNDEAPDHIETAYTSAGLGSDCTGSDGERSRVFTISTTATPIKEEVYVDGMRISPDDYTSTYSATSLVITFDDIDIWDSQQIVVDYRVY